MRCARTRGVRRGRRDERGVASLFEVVAVIALLTIVLGVVYQGMTSTSNAIAGSSDRLRNLDEARLLMATTSKDLRTAVRLTADGAPFTLADGNEVVFYANLDPVQGPKLVRLSIDATDQLVEEVWDPDAASSAPAYTYTGESRIRFVGQYVDNDAARPLFTYLDADGAALESTPLGAEDRRRVRAVRITMIVKKASAYAPNATTLVNQVRLPNLDYSAVAQ